MSVKQVLHPFAALAAAAVLAATVAAPPASGEALSPWWGVTSGSEPTNLVSGETGRIVVTAQNRGDVSTSGEVTISDVLPAGLEATAIKGVAGEQGGGGPVSCTPQTLTCTYSGSLHPYEQIEVDISVSVRAGARSGEENTATVSGGGAAGGGGSVSASHAIEVDGSERFGVENYQLIAEESGGSLDAQAGSHPFQLTSVVTLNTKTPEPETEGGKGAPRGVALAKDIVSELPAGLIADPAPFAQCTEAQFETRIETAGFPVNECPAQSAIGVATVTFNEPSLEGFDTATTPIFNLKPTPGEPARFGIDALGLLPMVLDASIRSGGDYGVTLTASNITEIASLLSLKLTFWGVPGDQRHDAQRGWECLEDFGGCPSSQGTPPPFLSLPTSCEAPLQSTLRGDSWGSPRYPSEQAEPVTYSLRAGLGEPLSLVGCNQIPFEPSIAVAPEAQDASTPSGLSVHVHVPQEIAENPAGLASSSVKNITIALPEGVALNPAGVGGLGACSESEIGYLPGASEPPGELRFVRGLPEPLSPGPNLEALGFCPNASKIGTVTLKTPVLLNPLTGFVYLAAPQSFRDAPPQNPFGSLLALYIVAEDPVSGTLVKLAGRISLNDGTGQITVTFEGTPQLPIEDIDLEFFAGERALLATPSRCGAYTTNASFAPWSGEVPVPSTSSFEITTGPTGGAGGSGGLGCRSSPLAFAPSMTAGTASLNAGSFSPLTVTVSRADGQQPLQGLRLRLPAGLSAMLAGVPLCPEVEANAGTCTSASEIGQTTVAAGLGAEPYILGGGKVYLTGPYNGTGPCTPGQIPSSSCAPFGLSIVTPVKAGPLDLEDAPESHPACDCLVIRASIEVDPQTAQLTIATAAIPSIIDGVPLQIKHLNININRSGFIFNPSSCNPMQVEGAIAGGEGAQAAVSSSFQMANCKNLKFKPKLTASTEGHAEALKGGNGASLNVKVVLPAEGPQSTTGTTASAGSSGSSSSRSSAQTGEANIRRIDLTLPRLLPARLQPTLQNACTRARFAKDPASCPPDSFVGTATAVTPVLGGVPGGGPGGKAGGGLGGQLNGPAIFVSQGGASLPDLDIVLQGEGVEILLTGHTDVKGEVTYAKFETFPDVPISSFALTLPQGPHSALASGLPTNKHSLCGQTLQMPATIEGQNGAVAKQNTKVKIEGCKPALYIRSTKVSGKSVTLTVTVPSAGKIVASGAGLSSQAKRPGGEKRVTLKLTLNRAQAATLAKGHRLKVRVELAFTPKRGKRLAKSLAVSFS